MNAGENYGFQQPVELCKQTHQEITQTMYAEFRMKSSNFQTNLLKEVKSTHDFQAYAYPRLTENEISQQSADQLLRSRFNPVEFDGFRMRADLFSTEQEDKL